MKKILSITILSMLVILSSIAFADTKCTYAPVVTTQDLYDVNMTNYNLLSPVGENYTFSSFINITPVATVEIWLNETMTVASNGSYGVNDISWLGIDNNTVRIYNITVEITSDAGRNWTVNNYTTPANTSGGGTTKWYITWINSTFNGSLVNVTFNKTFVRGVDNIGTVAGAAKICGAGCSLVQFNQTPTLGGATGWRLDNTTQYGRELNIQDWSLMYSYTNKSCGSGPDTLGCQNTKTTVFAAFALVALFAIIGAAFLIINIFRGGGADASAVMVSVVMIIGLGIVVMIGYVVISSVASSIC